VIRQQVHARCRARRLVRVTPVELADDILDRQSGVRRREVIDDAKDQL